MYRTNAHNAFLNPVNALKSLKKIIGMNYNVNKIICLENFQRLRCLSTCIIKLYTFVDNY